MESEGSHENVTFRVLQTRLIAVVNARIQSGDFTERGLARILGVSQPQMHNVLKGTRKLRPELADRLISLLGMTVLDLVASGELHGQILSRSDFGSHLETPAEIIGSHVPPRRLGIERKPAGRQMQWFDSEGQEAS